jgi:hypothetical protein
VLYGVENASSYIVLHSRYDVVSMRSQQVAGVL